MRFRALENGSKGLGELVSFGPFVSCFARTSYTSSVLPRQMSSTRRPPPLALTSSAAAAAAAAQPSTLTPSRYLEPCSTNSPRSMYAHYHNIAQQTALFHGWNRTHFK